MMRYFRYAAAGLVLTLGLSGCIGIMAGRPAAAVPCCLAGAESSSDFLSGKNMLTGFLLAGPFSAAKGRSPAADSLHFPYLKNERGFSGREKLPGTARIVVVPEDPKAASCDLNAAFPSADVLYALTCIKGGSEHRDVTLHLGSSGYIKVWWNGELVHTYDKSPRIGARDQDTVEHLTLKKGDNLLLIKCVRTGKNWDLFCRFSQNGRPLLLTPAAP